MNFCISLIGIIKAAVFLMILSVVYMFAFLHGFTRARKNIKKKED